MRRFQTLDGSTVTAASFPSPEAIVVPSHTGARLPRSWRWTLSPPADAAPRRGVAPVIARLVKRSQTDRAIANAPEGPDASTREGTTFAIYVEARGSGGGLARAWVTGRDPYGLTAEIQAWAASRAVAGKVTARGVLAPSVAYPPRDAFAELAFTSMKLED